MALSHRQQIVSTAVLMVVLMTFAALIYRAFTADGNARQAEYRRRAEAAQPPRKSMVTSERVILIRGETVTVNRTRLVFKGLADDTLYLDLYLLDLDPDYAYPKQISRIAAKTKFRLGSVRYRLITVNRKALTLKILE